MIDLGGPLWNIGGVVIFIIIIICLIMIIREKYINRK